MREGLRSRKRLEKSEGDHVSGRGIGQKKGHIIKQDASDFSGVDPTHEREPLALKVANKEVEKVVKGCELDWDMGTGTNVVFIENGNNGRVLSCGDNIERKVKKEGDSNDKVPIGGRVLRSHLKRADGKKSVNEDNNVVVLSKSRECDGSKKIQVKSEKLEANEYISTSYEEKKIKENKEGNDKWKLKRKRGRPPKKEITMQVGVLRQKQGRLPKAGQNYELMRMARSENRKASFQKVKKGLTMREGAHASPTKVCSKKRSFGKELKEDFSPVKIENNEGASPSRSNSSNVPISKKSVKSKAKQLVRDQIMKLLTAAGWTVDYRPRIGRIYNDAVYVSLDRKTHWSITLAYNRLKKHYEDGDGEGKVYGPGFKFTPIPEEEFKTLTKVISKKRKGKKKSKQKGKRDGNKVNGVNKKVKEEREGPIASLDKSMKGKMKRKRSLIEEHHSDVASPSRTLILGRDHKRQKTRNKKRCVLLVRDVEKEIDSEVNGYVPYNGKRTLLAWMIDMGTILQNGKVHYMNHRRKGVALEGRITGDGIHCSCCNEIVTISEFEAHAGSKLSDPFRNIYTEGGTSLLQCLLDSWNKQDESERKGFHFIDVAGEDPNDDTCGVCGDGGDLICCDSCPSTFHQSCLRIKKFPFGDWHCIYCCCKFCGLFGSANKRDDDGDIAESALFTCRLCGQKYHRSCIEADCAQIDDFSDAFCGNRCQKLHETLNMLLGVKHDIGDGFSWTCVQRSDVGSDASKIKSQMVECNSKLAVALLIMDECFMPYIDQRSGINMIHSILYNCGSNFNRLNYSGFFTAILERGDEIICVASIRIHGSQLAEMPFIGTRSMYRRQGMCRLLLSSIECALSSLNVGLLVIPAVTDVRETWTSVFAFEPLDPTSNQIIKNMNLLVFPHVDMLQKKIPKPNSAEENLIPTEVSNSHLQKNQKTHEVENICHELGSSGSEVIVSAGVPPPDAGQINDKSISIESGPKLPNGPFNDTPAFDSETVHNDKCSEDVKCEEVCHTIYYNLMVEDKGTIEGPDNVSHADNQAEQTNTCKNANSGCFIPAHNEKTVDSDNPSCHFLVYEKGRQYLAASDEIVTNGNSAEDSPCLSSESIPHRSQIVSCVSESKDSDESAYDNLKSISPRKDDGRTLPPESQRFQFVESAFCSHKNSSSCELISNHDSVQHRLIKSKELISEDLPVNCIKPSSVVSELNADEEVCAAKTPNLQTINSGDCQSVQMASGSDEEIANGEENSKVSSVAEFSFLPADRNLVLINNAWMDHSSELSDPGLQVDRAAQCNGSSLCSPNTAGVALHCASAGGTEVIVLSNKAS